jgi:hypothetical protein
MRILDQHVLFDTGMIGDWCFVNNFHDLWLCYPMQSSYPNEPPIRDIIHLYIHKAGEPVTRTPSWLWDGSLDTPTLTPSIGVAMGTPRQFHGYLTAGILRSV